MKRNLLTLAFCISFAAAYCSDSLIVRRAVYFDVDQYQLGAPARQQLDSMVAALRDQGECSVSIYGSTDIDGSAGYNQQLSERRARAVQDYLLSHDIKAVKCLSRGLGRRGDEASKTENRRVDVELRFTLFSGVDEVFESLSKDAEQHFTIDPLAPAEIKCRGNTRISIPAGALLLPNGEKATDNVSVTVKEAVDMADILSQDLNSVSDGKMLETRGMVYIAATSGGQKLSIDPASPISVSIASPDAKENDMKLFYGARHGDQTMNWKVADAGFKPDVKTVPFDLDRSMLSDMAISGRQMPGIPLPTGEASLPLKPFKPRKPIAVSEPQHDNAYKGTPLERAFNKKKIESKNEALYQQALKKYEESVEKQKTYGARLDEYETAMSVYDQKMKAFRAEGERRMAAARQYFRGVFEYAAVSDINRLIAFIQKVPVSNKSVLTVFAHSRIRQYSGIDRHQQLRQILGDTYYKFYHLDDPRCVITDPGDIPSRDSADHDFIIAGYAEIYDSLMKATHLADTLGALQDRITARCVELGLFDQKNVSGYIASVSQLGWINCDRFTQTPPDQLVTMRIDEPNDVKMYVVFKDIKSCLPVYRTAGGYETSRIPKGKDVRVVAVKVVDGKPRLAVAQVNTSRKDPLVLDYKTCSLTEIRMNFAAL